MKAEINGDNEIILIPEGGFEEKGLENVSRGPYNLFEQTTVFSDPDYKKKFILRHCDVSIKDVAWRLQDIYKELTGKRIPKNPNEGE